MTESANDAITCLIFSSLYRFYSYRFFSSSSWSLAYSYCILMSWNRIKKYLKSLSFRLLSEPSLVFLVFLHNLLESVELFFLTISHFQFFKGDFFLDLFDELVVKLVFFFFLDFFPFRFIFNLSVSHLFFKINFSLVFILLFFFSLIIESGLLLLQSVVLLCFFLFALFFSAFFFHLLVELFLYLFLELFLSHSLQLLFLLEQLCIKLDESGPFIIVIALDLIYWLRRYWTGLWVFW